MSRTATWVAMTVLTALYYIFVGGTAEGFVNYTLGAGIALTLHWISNR